MLFGKRKRVVKRILIVEDEPLTAFDTETMLNDFGYEVVATLDDFDQAVEHLDREEIHLVVADVPPPSTHALGCLRKPYTERMLKQALDCVDRHLQGESVKPLKGLEFYPTNAE